MDLCQRVYESEATSDPMLARPGRESNLEGTKERKNAKVVESNFIFIVLIFTFHFFEKILHMSLISLHM